MQNPKIKSDQSHNKLEIGGNIGKNSCITALYLYRYIYIYHAYICV